MASRRRKKTGKRTRKAYKRKPASFGIQVLNTLILGVSVSFFVGYLVMNNQAATQGFTIRSVEKRIAELEHESRELDIEAVSIQSMKHIEEQIGGLGMVPVSSVDYISAIPPAVAVK